MPWWGWLLVGIAAGFVLGLGALLMLIAAVMPASPAPGAPPVPHPYKPHTE
jgi:hypothetical protein